MTPREEKPARPTPKDTDIIPMTRKCIKDLAYCRNMLKGHSHQDAIELASTFANRLISTGSMLENDAEVNAKTAEDHVL